MSFYKQYHFAHLVCELPGQGPLEQVMYHREFLRFHTQLVERAKRMGKRFHSMHAEDFQRAHFPALLDNLDSGERSIAEELFKNGRRQDEVIWQVINYRMFRQIQAIVKGSGTAEGISSWVDLFNSFMRYGTANAPAKSALRIYFADGEGFIHYFLEHMAASINFEGENFKTLKVEAEEMARFLEVNRQNPALGEASFNQFLKWIDLYQSLVQQESDE